MIRDLFNEIKVQLYERATSPLLGSFVISWCLWNYDFFLVLFSGDALVFKLSFLKVYIFPSDWSWVYWRVVGPLVTTVAYIYIYPIPAQWVYQYTRNQHRKMKEIQQASEDLTPLTREESRKIRVDARAIARKHDEELSEAQAEIDLLKSDLKAAESDRGEMSQKTQSALDDEKNIDVIDNGTTETHADSDTKSDDQIQEGRDPSEFDPIKRALSKKVKLTKEKRIEFFNIAIDIMSELSSTTSTISSDVLKQNMQKNNSDLTYILKLLQDIKFIRVSNGYVFMTSDGNDYVVEMDMIK